MSTEIKAPKPRESWLRELAYHFTMGIAFKPVVAPVTALDIATAEFQQAQIDLLDHCKMLEYHEGMVNMLNSRIERLEGMMIEMRALSLRQLQPISED